MRDELIKFLEKNLGVELDFDKLLEKPKLAGQGDFALPMFILARDLKKAPPMIAADMVDKLADIKLPAFLSKVEASGPYLNFYLNNSLVAKGVLDSVLDGSIFEVKDCDMKRKKMLIEYPSPNTNKSLHLGHVRNMLLGNSLTKIFRGIGYDVIKTCMNNDRGIAICKSMLGYSKFYSKDTPESLKMKSDEFVSMCYVRFGTEAKKDESLDTEAQEMLVKWEAGDKDVMALWKKVMDWVFEGYKQTYADYKLGGFDREYYESEIYKEGKDIVEKALKEKVKGFGVEDDGAAFCDCEDAGFDKKYLMRGDGTTLYMTQDLYLAKLKEEEFKPDMSFFIVGKEQQYHFNVLFEILDRLGFGGNEANYHFAYGYVYNKDGKKFSSRKGEVVGADWLLSQVVSKALDNLKSKEISAGLDVNELDRRAKIIGYAALSFSFLKPNPLDDIKFDLDRALDMSGESGPYVQYTYARIQSVLKKAKWDGKSDIDWSLFGERESALIKLLGEFNGVVLEAGLKYKPSHIANYLIRVCQGYNEFYQNCPILKEKDEIKNARLLLCDAVSRVIKSGLELLDIEVLDEM